MYLITGWHARASSRQILQENQWDISSILWVKCFWFYERDQKEAVFKKLLWKTENVDLISLINHVNIEKTTHFVFYLLYNCRKRQKSQENSQYIMPYFGKGEKKKFAPTKWKCLSVKILRNNLVRQSWVNCLHYHYQSPRVTIRFALMELYNPLGMKDWSYQVKWKFEIIF